MPSVEALDILIWARVEDLRELARKAMDLPLSNEVGVDGYPVDPRHPAYPKAESRGIIFSSGWKFPSS